MPGRSWKRFVASRRIAGDAFRTGWWQTWQPAGPVRAHRPGQGPVSVLSHWIALGPCSIPACTSRLVNSFRPSPEAVRSASFRRDFS